MRERMIDWVGELSPRVSVLAVGDSVRLLVGHFRCRPTDPAWNEVNRVGEVAHVVFPRTAVEITPVGAEPIATDANRVVLYGAGEEYRRARLDPRGDDCVFVAVGEELLDELGAVSRVVDPRRRGFARRVRDCAPIAYAGFRLLERTRRGADDPLASDELLLALLEAALGGEDVTGSVGSEPLVEDARTLLATRYREPLALEELAAEVGASPYHLHRRFRAVTGWTMHTYRDNLRLREGLARIAGGADDLSRLALDLGYSSHSHFTSRFRRVFGVTPSSVRRRGPAAVVAAEHPRTARI